MYHYFGGIHVSTGHMVVGVDGKKMVIYTGIEWMEWAEEKPALNIMGKVWLWITSMK